MFHKKLRTMGGSWGLVIPKMILEALGINPVLDEVTLIMEPDGLKIKKRTYKK